MIKATDFISFLTLSLALVVPATRVAADTKAVTGHGGISIGQLKKGGELSQPPDSVRLRMNPDAPTWLRIIDSHSQQGINIKNPRFAWIFNDLNRGESQSAYQIIVASSASNTERQIGDCWDSGFIDSSQQYGVTYSGKALSTHRQYWWKVRVKDKDGNVSPWSAAQTFSTGFLSASDWDTNTKWIYWAEGQEVAVCPMFRREFSLGKRVKRATAYVCGLGHFELSLNGHKVGDHELDPGWTDYKDTCLYVTFDVTDSLQPGGNALGIMLGNGFYNNWATTRWQHYATPSFGPKKMIFELHVEFADSTTAKIVSDRFWTATGSPVVFSHVMGGEDYDARREQPGWNKAGFNDSAWNTATETNGPGGTFVSQYAPPIKVQGVYDTRRILEPAKGIYVYDFGQNMSGLPVIKVKGTAGAQIKLSPAEYLEGMQHASGRVDQFSLTNGRDNMYYIYTCKGEGIETWSPQFTYTGYRYVEAQVISGSASIIDMQSKFVYADATVSGSFTCSDNDYNQIYDLCLKAYQSNMQSILTDCPHREKLGYIQCAHSLGPSHMYLYDMQTIFEKTCQDMRESVRSDGLVHPESPNYVEYWGSIWPAAEVTIILLPWLVYQNYGDVEILKENYTLMKQQIAIIDSKCTGHIAEYCGGAVGDWGGAQRNAIQTETGVFHAAINVMKEIATVLGHSSDVTFYTGLAKEARAAYNQRFFNNSQNYYNPGGDGPNALPLYWGFAPSGKEQNVVEYIADYITNHNNGNFSAGEVTIGYLFQSLSRYERNDIVELMIQQQDAPSYKDLINKGATTLTEFFDLKCSHNHNMFGHVIEWMYSAVAGISATKPGYEEIQIKPYVGKLSSCRGSVQTIRGCVISNWQLVGDKFKLDVTIPCNSRAVVHIPLLDFTDVVVKEGATILWEGNGVKGRVDGVSFKEKTKTYVIWNVGSGSYSFTLSKRN